MVAERYMTNPSPIPRFDNPKLHQADNLYLFGAGREKKIYAIPPYTDVVSLAFDDIGFSTERFEGKRCCVCGSDNTFLDELYDAHDGERIYRCSDTSYCREIYDANTRTSAAISE